jgi:anti-sigma factor (TIGR02949 family)
MTADRSPECTRILERISAYLDQELDAETCRAIEDHCATCPECANLVDGLRETIGLCRATANQPLPPNVKARARASIERLLAKPRPN